MSFVSIARTDLRIGAPLPWAVCDQDGNVLMQEGDVLQSEEQLASLLAARPLRELSWAAANGEPEDTAIHGDDTTQEVLEEEDSGETGLTFQDMRLRVGDRIQLQPPATVSTDRHVVRLIGYLDGVSVLVTAPMNNGLRLPLRENDKVVARIFGGQKAFGFSSTVQRVCKIPYDYLHLSFPDQIQGSVIRKSPRVKTRIITSIAVPGGGDSDKKSGVIVNLSADGALVRTRKPLVERGETIQMSFRINLHKLDAYLTVSAVVRSIFDDESEETRNDPMVNHGVQFQDVPANDTVILQSLIYQQMIEQPHTLA